MGGKHAAEYRYGIQDKIHKNHIAQGRKNLASRFQAAPEKGRQGNEEVNGLGHNQKQESADVIGDIKFPAAEWQRMGHIAASGAAEVGKYRGCSQNRENNDVDRGLERGQCLGQFGNILVSRDNMGNREVGDKRAEKKQAHGIQDPYDTESPDIFGKHRPIKEGCL